MKAREKSRMVDTLVVTVGQLNGNAPAPHSLLDTGYVVANQYKQLCTSVKAPQRTKSLLET